MVFEKQRQPQVRSKSSRLCFKGKGTKILGKRSNFFQVTRCADQEILVFRILARKLLQNISQVGADAENRPRVECPARFASMPSLIRGPFPSLRVQRELCGEFFHFFFHPNTFIRVADVRKHIHHRARDAIHLRFVHSASGNCWSSHTNSAGCHRRSGIKRNCIFIHCHSGSVERWLRLFSCNSSRENIHHEQVIVCAAADDLETSIRHPTGERTRIRHHLRLILAEPRPHRFPASTLLSLRSCASAGRPEFPGTSACPIPSRIFLCRAPTRRAVRAKFCAWLSKQNPHVEPDSDALPPLRVPRCAPYLRIGLRQPI